MMILNRLWLRLCAAVARFLADLRGVSSVEYALIVVAIIAIVGIGAATLGDAFEGMFDDLSDRMTAAAGEVSSAASS